jgi:hypothetical protein
MVLGQKEAEDEEDLASIPSNNMDDDQPNCRPSTDEDITQEVQAEFGLGNLGPEEDDYGNEEEETPSASCYPFEYILFVWCIKQTFRIFPKEMSTLRHHYVFPAKLSKTSQTNFSLKRQPFEVKLSNNKFQI